MIKLCLTISESSHVLHQDWVQSFRPSSYHIYQQAVQIKKYYFRPESDLHGSRNTLRLYTYTTATCWTKKHCGSSITIIFLDYKLSCFGFFLNPASGTGIKIHGKQRLVFVCSRSTNRYLNLRLTYLINNWDKLLTARYSLNIRIQFRFVCLFVFGKKSPQWDRACSFTRFLDHIKRRSTVGRTPLDEWSARRRDPTWQHTTLTTDKHPCPRWDSKPQSLQANCRRPTP